MHYNYESRLRCLDYQKIHGKMDGDAMHDKVPKIVIVQAENYELARTTRPYRQRLE